MKWTDAEYREAQSRFGLILSRLGIAYLTTSEADAFLLHLELIALASEGNALAKKIMDGLSSGELIFYPPFKPQPLR